MARTATRVRATRAHPSTPRRSRRWVAVLAIVVVGVLIALGVALRRPEAAPAAGTFPDPVAVPSTTTRLASSGGARATAWILPSYGGPRDVLVDATGTVWLSEADAGVLSAFHAGSLTRYQLGRVFAGAGTFRLGTGDNGDVWFTSYPDGSVGRILPNGSANVFAPFAQGQSSASIVRADDGSMWVTDPARGMLLRIGADGIATQLAAPGVGPHPYDAVALGGSIWFTDPSGTSIGRLDPSTGQIEQIRVGAAARSIAAAPDGTLWITRSKARTVVRVDPRTGATNEVPVTADGALNDVAVAPDGTLWLTQEAPFVLHLSATGALLDRVRLPGGARFADGIAIDADGVAWAATVSGNSLVEIHP